MDDQHAESDSSKSGINPYVISVAILIAGAMIAGAVMYAEKDADSTAQKQPAPSSPVAVITDSRALADDDPSLGNPDAPVTIVEFADFQCPFCGRFYATVTKPLMEKYIATGKVKFVYRDFAFLGPESEWAAQAANSACSTISAYRSAAEKRSRLSAVTARENPHS